MLKVYYKGKMRRILGIQVCDETGVLRDVTAWYDVNKRKIWPDDSARSNALRVKLPEKGTEAWAYWVHAVDALRTVGAAEDCYLYVEFGGKRYYLIDSPDGSEPLQVEGNSLYFSGDGDFPTEGVGATVSVHGVVPQRCGGKRWTEWDTSHPTRCQYWQRSGEFTPQFDSSMNGADAPDWFAGLEYVIYSSWRGLLPILPDTLFHAQTSKGHKEQNVRFMFRVSGVSSGDVYCERKAARIGGRGERDASENLKKASYTEAYDVWVNSGNVYHAPDTGFKLEMWTYCTGGTGTLRMSSVCVVNPQFSKTWELVVESINELAL